jgi:hypothetical protein
MRVIPSSGRLWGYCTVTDLAQNVARFDSYVQSAVKEGKQSLHQDTGVIARDYQQVSANPDVTGLRCRLYAQMSQPENLQGQ